MAIRGLLWLALLFAIAVVLAVVGRFDMGQVLLIYPPYRVDISLNLFVVGLVVLFILIYALLRIVRNIWRMPQRVAAYRARSRVAKAHAALRDAIGNLYAGRFSRAEKAAKDSLANGDNKGAAGLIAATAAHRMHEYARRDEWLAQIDEADWQDARLMATADMRADGRDADGALSALTEMQSQGARRIHAQQIMLRAQQQLKNWGEVLKLVKTLEKREAIHPAVAVRLRAHPLIRAVEVSRRLPGTLVVEVEERVPVGLVPTPTLQPVDRDGHRLPLALALDIGLRLY